MGATGAALSAAMWLASHCFGSEWSAYDVRVPAAPLTTSMRLMYGVRDGQSPVHVSAQLAARRPRPVTRSRFEGAGHCQSWDERPEPCEREARESAEAIHST